MSHHDQSDTGMVSSCGLGTGLGQAAAGKSPTASLCRQNETTRSQDDVLQRSQGQNEDANAGVVMQAHIASDQNKSSPTKTVDADHT